MYLSTNNGVNWTQIGNRSAFCLYATGGNLYAGTWSGAFFSSDSGATWDSIGLSNVGYIHAFAVINKNLFAATDGNGIFRSSDNGTSWTQADSGLPGLKVFSLVVKDTNIFAGLYGGGVFLSTQN